MMASSAGRGPTFKVINLGCKVNRAESDSIEDLLASKAMVASDENCSVVVLNTCTVTAVAEKKTRKAVRQALAESPMATVVVTGCAAAQNRTVYEEMSARVKVVLKWELDSFLNSKDFTSLLNVDGKIAIPERPNDDSAFNESVSPSHLRGALEPRLNEAPYCRANVKVQDGCANECSYCIIHKLRGPERSVDPEIVIERSKALSDSGISEIMLAGINLGKYSFDDIDLSGLCKLLLKEDMRCRFRLSSIEPENLHHDVIELVASSNGRLCRHFHLPLQSGSDKVLSKMNRNYTSEQFLDVVGSIRSLIPNASISTDVICGFPGEEERDFEETLELCKNAAFSKIHVFPFSEREGTPACDMPGNVPKHVRMERAKKLRDLAAALRDEDLRSRKGSKELAVVEDEDWCMTESYHRVKAPKGAEPGMLVEIEL